MNELLEIIEQKKQSALNDYNRFMQKPNAYEKQLLLVRGQYEAYLDIECYIKSHREVLDKWQVRN